MENNQNIGDIINSILKEVNVNNQIESTLNLINKQSNQITELEEKIGKIKQDKLKESIDALRKNMNIELDKKQSKIKYRFDLFLWGIVIIALVAIFCSQIPYFRVNDNYVGLVIGFVGVLATFVIVGNYAQVNSIERKIDNIERDIQNAFDDASKDIDKNKHEAIATIFFSLGRSLYSNENYLDSLDYFIKSFSGFNQIKNEKNNKSIDECIEKIYSILSEKADNFNISEETRISYYNMLNEIEDSDVRKETIIFCIKNIPKK